MKTILIVMIMIFSGCGSPERWESLPVTVTVAGDAQLVQATADAVAMLNGGLGAEVFMIGEGGPINVSCGETEEGFEGKAYFDGGEWITECAVTIKAFTNCGNGSKNGQLVAHELFHCLGFGGHSINADSLMTDHAIPCGAGVDPEMVAMFSDKYPEVGQ